MNGYPFNPFPKSSFSIAKILKQQNFKIIFSSINKLSFSKLKDPIETLYCWGIYSISCQCGLSYIGQIKHRLCFHLSEHKFNIRNQETNKSAIVKHCWENYHTFNFHSAKIIGKPNSVFELDFFGAFHIHKNHNNVVN